MDTALSHASRRGFSLIEAAIVLGVVGVVIGGIWIAASAAVERRKISELIAGHLTASDNIRKVVSLADANAYCASAGCPPYGVPFASEFLVGANIFPHGWAKNGNVFSPFGRITVAVYSSPALSFRYFDLPRQACIEFILRLSSLSKSGSKMGSGGLGSHETLSYLQVNWPAWNFATFPVSFDAASAACTSETANIIYTYQAFTRNN